MVYFITGNKELISIYSDATFENTNILDDLSYRLFWFDPEFFLL